MNNFFNFQNAVRLSLLLILLAGFSNLNGRVSAVEAIVEAPTNTPVPSPTLTPSPSPTSTPTTWFIQVAIFACVDLTEDGTCTSDDFPITETGLLVFLNKGQYGEQTFTGPLPGEYGGEATLEKFGAYGFEPYAKLAQTVRIETEDGDGCPTPTLKSTVLDSFEQKGFDKVYHLMLVVPLCES